MTRDEGEPSSGVEEFWRDWDQLEEKGGENPPYSK